MHEFCLCLFFPTCHKPGGLRMEENLLFIAGLGISLFFLAIWGFKFLPKEKWQVLSTVPVMKTADGKWKGLNLTYYGFFNGVAVTIAAAIMIMLLGAVSIPLSGTLLFLVGTGLFAAPATKIVARIVEKKPCTLSIGGASFVGIIVAPWIALGVSKLFAMNHLPTVDVSVLLAAVSIAYSFGEGIGRLSCISFGCCYGKPISQLPKPLQFLFRRRNFVFQGETKKIAYASHLDGEAILPIQAITSIIYFISGLLGVYLFLAGHFSLAFFLTLSITQIWRVVSEFLRADYRGEGTLSVYQYLAFISVFYSIGVALWFSLDPVLTISIRHGINVMWDLPVILFLQGLFIAVFFMTGRSKVITAELSFQVQHEYI